jgi:hypothetical protein
MVNGITIVIFVSYILFSFFYLYCYLSFFGLKTIGRLSHFLTFINIVSTMKIKKLIFNLLLMQVKIREHYLFIYEQST